MHRATHRTTRKPFTREVCMAPSGRSAERSAILNPCSRCRPASLCAELLPELLSVGSLTPAYRTRIRCIPYRLLPPPARAACARALGRTQPGSSAAPAARHVPSRGRSPRSGDRWTVRTPPRRAAPLRLPGSCGGRGRSAAVAVLLAESRGGCDAPAPNRTDLAAVVAGRSADGRRSRRESGRTHLPAGIGCFCGS
jgi:hypothetical protein